MSANVRQSVSVIVPVWNGATVIEGCLEATIRNSGPALREIICVENASTDDSASIVASVAARAQCVHVLRQPTNLGFGGGVNVGMAAAVGDLHVLLNQDCLPHVGWLDALLAGLTCTPNAGIAGCTLYAADGGVDHAGARISRPLALGEHLTDTQVGVREMDYVTGAIFAITARARETVGDFDEGFFPAYYEESDYCYRARVKGLVSIYVPGASGTHIRSSREWQRDGLAHTINNHRSRYRFVLKHFDDAELLAFFSAEQTAALDERHYDQAAGRVVAARVTLRHKPEIAARRKRDIGRDTSVTRHRLAESALRELAERSLQRALALAECDDAHLNALEARAQDVMRRMHGHPKPAVDSRPALERNLRLLGKRAVSLLSGHGTLAEREVFLQTQLDLANSERLLLLRRRSALMETLLRHDTF